MKKLFCISVWSLALVGCGGDDDGGGGGGADIGDIIADLDNPTGDVTTAEGAQGVAQAFADLQASQALGGQRRSGISCDTSGTQVVCECTGGGTLEVTGGTASGPSAEASGKWEANSCCESGAEACCYDGTLEILVNQEQGATYPLCYFADYDVSQCKSASVNVSYCMDNEGNEWWVVEYETDTFAVSGYYTEGAGGQWTIRDMDTTWSCVEDATGAGCCTADDGSEPLVWDGGEALCP